MESRTNDVQTANRLILFLSSDVGLPDVNSPVNIKTVKSQPAVTIRTLPGEEPYYPFGLSEVLSEFGHYSDIQTCQPVAITDHCWGGNSIIYCSCEGGQVLKLDAEAMTVVLLVNPAQDSDVDNEEDDVRKSQDGSANCIAVNKTGVHIGGKVWCVGVGMMEYCLGNGLDLDETSCFRDFCEGKVSFYGFGLRCEWHSKLSTHACLHLMYIVSGTLLIYETDSQSVNAESNKLVYLLKHEREDVRGHTIRVWYN